MGKRGPAREPAAAKLAKGTFRADRDSSLMVGDGMPTPPQWLKSDAREVWDVVVADLAGVDGLLARVDAYALARYCNDWVQYWKAERIIAKSGMVACAESGAEYQHPAVGIMNKASDRMSKFEARFGMTPSDRCSLKVQPTKSTGVRARARA